jgi:parallel beta-helix repeat protein
MVLARWPNTKWAKTGKIINAGSVYSKDKKGNEGGVFGFSNKRIYRWIIEPDLWLHGFWKHEWYDEAIPLKKIDLNRKYIELGSAHYYGIEEKKRFYVFNALSELDTPGEYYIDRKKMILYFWPVEDSNKGDLVISVLKSPLVVFRNASNIIFNNLIFAEGRDSGILIKGGSNIMLDNITVKNMGGDGVIIRGGNNHVVSNSTFTNLGTKGIVVSGGKRERLFAANHLIENNEIKNFGRRIYTKSWGIEIKGVGNVISKNTIHDAPHTAIRVYGNNHKIIENDIFNICNETSDAGAIYLGRDWTERGNLIERNYIHDSSSLKGKGDVIGVYLDDLASGSIIKSNIISNIYRGILVGGGRDNLIYNNLINQAKISISIDSRGLHWASSWTKGNGILKKRLQAMPFSSQLWKKSYPQLAKINENNPAFPKNNIIVKNAIFNSGEIKRDPVSWIYSKIKSNFEFKNNVELNKTPIYIEVSENLNKMIKSKIIGWEDIRINK